MSENSLDVRVGLQHIFSNSQAFAAVKISRLFGNNGKLLIGNFMEAFAAFAGCGSSGNAFKLSNFYFFTQFLDDVFGCHFAAFDVIGGDEGCYGAFVGAAVKCQNGNVGFVGSLNGSGYCCGVNRVDEQDIYFLLDQVGNIIGLFSRVVLRVDDFNIDAEFFSFVFNAFAYGYEEGVVERGDGEADSGGFFAVGRFCSFVAAAAAAGSEYCQYCDGSY